MRPQLELNSRDGTHMVGLEYLRLDVKGTESELPFGASWDGAVRSMSCMTAHGSVRKEVNVDISEDSVKTNFGG